MNCIKKEKAKEGLWLNGASEAGCRLECTVIFRSDSFNDQASDCNRDGLGLKKEAWDVHGPSQPTTGNHQLQHRTKHWGMF